MSKSILPEWLLNELPEVREPSVLSMNGEQFRITDTDGSHTDYATLEEASRGKEDSNLVISPEVYTHCGQDPDGFALTYPAGEHFQGLFITLTDDDRLRMLERDYEYSLRCHIRYQNAPDSFLNAYNFVDAHPAFWFRRRGTEDFPWDWETAGHCGRVEQLVMRVEREEDNPEAYPQGYVIALETGGHVESRDEHFGSAAYTSHYHDYRLDVYALTFEQAFIDLARLVDKFFFIDGTQKPEVDHEKPAWIVELEGRIEELDRLREEEKDDD